jgi:hypothetical protein
MANPESAPDSSSDVSQDVYRFFEEQQTHNPEYLRTLAAQLWNELSPETRQFRMHTLAIFFGGDLHTLEQAARAQLLGEYADSEIERTRDLNQRWRESEVVPIFREAPTSSEYDDDEVRPPAA